MNGNKVIRVTFGERVEQAKKKLRKNIRRSWSAQSSLMLM